MTSASLWHVRTCTLRRGRLGDDTALASARRGHQQFRFDPAAPLYWI